MLQKNTTQPSNPTRTLRIQPERGVTMFIIGARVRRWWMLHHLFWVNLAFGRMVRELRAHPELGCLHIRTGPSLTVMTWESREQLVAYARAADHAHLPAWQRFNRLVRQSRSVGFWHEIYEVDAGAHHAVYVDAEPEGIYALAG